MLDLVDADQLPNNADLPSDFEFAMPLLAHHDSFRKPDGTETSPADELFYRGQLLPLLWPCRLKMVQDLYDFNKAQAVISSEDADPPCQDVPCAQGPRVRIMDVLADHEEPMLHTQKHRPNAVSVVVSKPRLRWKLFSRRARRCSLMEAACCRVITSTSEHRSRIVQSHTEVRCSSSVLRSGSFIGDCVLLPKIVSSSSAHMCRNPSKNSHRSAKRVQRGSLMIKAMDCLQKSLKVFKLGSMSVKQNNHQQRTGLLKQCDHGVLPASVTKNRRQVAHYDSSSSSSGFIGFECEDVINGETLTCPYAEVSDGNDNDDDDDELLGTAFITIEPSLFLQENLCNKLYDVESRLSPACAWGILDNDGNDTATSIELHHSIQGAIAHCKGSIDPQVLDKFELCEL